MSEFDDIQRSLHQPFAPGPLQSGYFKDGRGVWSWCWKGELWILRNGVWHVPGRRGVLCVYVRALRACCVCCAWVCTGASWRGVDPEAAERRAGMRLAGLRCHNEAVRARRLALDEVSKHLPADAVGVVAAYLAFPKLVMRVHLRTGPGKRFNNEHIACAHIYVCISPGTPRQR